MSDPSATSREHRPDHHVSRRGALTLLGLSAAVGLGASAAPAATAAPGVAAAPATTAPATTVPQRRRTLGPAAAVPVGGGRLYQADGVPVVVTQPRRGTFRAFNGTCPHAGCVCSQLPLPGDPANAAIVCPCHSSAFNADTGAVERGPATEGLTALPLRVTRGRLVLG